ncbi:HTTM domain-containing protein [Ilumatobacter sp.]|uniref:HTTM domain-containing protein n=1 Tax=Ilumatobacter sp. TaxID=1967498 RepID=UPI003AF4DF30
MNGATEMIRRVDRALARTVSVRSVSAVRMLVGAVAVLHLAPIASDAVSGTTFHGRFRQPYTSWYPELDPRWYTVMLVAGVVAAVAMTAGVAARAATIATTAVVGYHLFLSTTHVHHNRAYLFGVLLVLSMSRCGNAFSVDAWWARRAGRPLDPEAPAWPMWLLRFQCATVYGASGLSKLLDPDWFGGTVTWARVTSQSAMVRSSALPDIAVDLLLDRSFHSVAAKFVVLTELFIAGGLWWRRTRPWAVSAAVMFHVMIELSAEVQVFSYLGLAVLVIWAPPSLPLDRFRLFHTPRMTSSPTPLGGPPS